MSARSNLARNTQSFEAAGNINSTLRAPLYHQVFVLLRDRILSGVYSHGDTLPSEHEVMQQYGISRITAKRAFDELANAGLVTRARGRGTVVQYRPPLPPLRGAVSNWLETMTEMGRKTKVEVLGLTYAAATSDEINALELPPGSEVQRAVRLRSMDKSPFSHLTTAVPAEIGKRYSADDLAKHSLLKLLQRSGVVIGKANQVITATLADQTTAPRLDTELGAPLLCLRRIVRDKQDKPVEFLTALYRPDRYQLEMTLDAGEAARS